MISDGLLSSLTDEQFDAVWRPKAQALANLDELTQDMDLSAFVVFSSLAGVLGGAGQANYAAANTFVELSCSGAAPRAVRRCRWPGACGSRRPA